MSRVADAARVPIRIPGRCRGALSPLFIIGIAAGLTSTRALAQETGADPRPAPLSSSVERGAIFDISTIAASDSHSLLDREVVAEQVRVNETADRGFWVTPVGGADRIFIVPAEGSLIAVHAGELVSLHGEVRLMRNAIDRGTSRGRTSDVVAPYVYAYTVRPARPTDKPGH